MADFLNGYEQIKTWSYPPLLLPLILGFGFLTYFQALAAWTILTFMAFAFAMTYKRPHPALITTTLFLAPATYVNIYAGQNGAISAALLIGGFRLLDTAPILSGVLFGFLTYKPQLGWLIPLALLAGRHWKPFITATITFLILFALSIILYGIQPWQDYLAITLPYQRWMLEHEPIHVYSAMIPTPFMAVRHLGGSLFLAYSTAAIFAVLSAGTVVYTFLQKQAPRDLQIAIFATAVMLASPYILSYDMTLTSAAIVLLLLWRKPQSFKPLELLLLMLVWLLPLGVIWLNYIKLPITPLILTAFLAFLVRLLLKIKPIN